MPFTEENLTAICGGLIVEEYSEAKNGQSSGIGRSQDLNRH